TRSYGDWSSDVCSSDLCVFAARYIVGGGRADWPAAAAAFTAATLIRHIGVAVAAGATVAVIVRIGEAWDGSHTGPRPVRHMSNRSEERRVGKARRARCV